MHETLPEFDPSRVQCFIEFTHGFPNDKDEDKYKGRLVFEVFDQEVPHTAENFRVLCTGEKAANFHYQGCRVTRIVPGFTMQTGDTSACGDGTGGKSIYDESSEISTNKDGKFEDENVWYPHTHRGTVGTYNMGETGSKHEPNTNGSQFCINLRDDNQFFDEKSTIFGRVISGFKHMDYFQNVERKEEKPLRPIYIEKCGELTGEDKLGVEEAEDLPMYAKLTLAQQKDIERRFKYKNKEKEREQQLKSQECPSQKQLNP